MFTGLVEERGVISERDTHRVRISSELVQSDAAVGDSIAVNGCCLTVVTLGEGFWEAELSDETISRTTLGDLPAGTAVNLERPLRVGDRLGGHIVAGHVDGVGEVLAAAPDLVVGVPSHLERHLVEKGSVAVDGVSLTVAGLGRGSFVVAVIPHTAEVTNLGGLVPGDRVNLETDVLAKHVERLLAANIAAGGSPTHGQESS